MLKVFHILPMTYVNLLFFFDVHVCINVRPYREVCWLQTETATLTSSGSNKNILKIFLMFLYVSIHMFPQERYTKRYVVYVTKRMGWKSLCQAVFKKKRCGVFNRTSSIQYVCCICILSQGQAHNVEGSNYILQIFF